MADVNRGNRPLSPHLSIYRMTVTMLVSIVNRITGVGMALASFLIVWWLMAAATSPEYFATVSGYLTSWLGLLILVGSLWALWFHFIAGLRHIWMDFGKGYDLNTATTTGWVTVIGSVVMTVLSLICII